MNILDPEDEEEHTQEEDSSGSNEDEDDSQDEEEEEEEEDEDDQVKPPEGKQCRSDPCVGFTVSTCMGFGPDERESLCEDG